MRHSHIILSSLLIPTNDECPNSPVTSQSFRPKKCSYNAGSHSFTNCSWDNTDLSSNGGAIHYRLTSATKSYASLTVDKCTFLHCKEAETVDGGAIYAAYIGTVSVTASLFYDCKSGTGQIGAEGGGICCYYIAVLPLIRTCTFLFCTTGDDGGGCGIWLSNASSVYVINSCRFLKCKGTHVDNSQGGGIMLSFNEVFVTITNCLLCACETKYQGGGVLITQPSDTSLQPLTFCFFHDNKSPIGKDVCFYEYNGNIQLILYSFSSDAAAGRVDGGPDNWLPHTCTLIFKNTLWF